MEAKPFPESILPLYDDKEDRARWGREDRAFYGYLDEILKVEKGWNEGDGGTWRGIAQDPFYTPFKDREANDPTYSTWPRFVGNLEESQVISLYRSEFWRRPKIYRLLEVEGLTDAAPLFIEQVFDYGINSSPATAIEDLQLALNDVLSAADTSFEPLATDGLIGRRTLAALESAAELGLVVEVNDALVDLRRHHNKDSELGDPGLAPRAEKYRIGPAED